MSNSHHNRFYIAPGDFSGDTFRISAGELRHFKVKRLQPGDTLTALDGEGGEFRGEVIRIDRGGAQCAVIETIIHSPPSRKISLGIGIIRPGALAFACEKAAELGTWCIIPILAERSNRVLSQNEIDRLNQITLSSMKQSGSYYHSRVLSPKTIPALFTEYYGIHRFIHTDIGGGSIYDLPDYEEDLLVLVGPEGGFTDDEVKLMNDFGAVLVSLGGSRLRSETAAVVALGCLFTK
ncbi:MAG: 16S rRNA (uracil(1498)-N(3))-methyltransferase [candidate division Zixibacteria bacterium]|nr:16S rRNA (uracil(1498)-N(3))-methyltransferase [Candidatus Tariuqbacter arcticus]